MYNIASALTHERLAKDVFEEKSDADELLRRGGRNSPWMGLKGEREGPQYSQRCVSFQHKGIKFCGDGGVDCGNQMQWAFYVRPAFHVVLQLAQINGDQDSYWSVSALSTPFQGSPSVHITLHS